MTCEDFGALDDVVNRVANGEIDDDVGTDVMVDFMVDFGVVVMVDVKIGMIQLCLMKENT